MFSFFSLNICYNKKPQLFSRGSPHKFGGLERIRTAVDGFADRCLAARPQDHFRVTKLIRFFVVANGMNIYFFYKKLVSRSFSNQRIFNL